ncbi:unnamed protein product, partial [Staurois parvus]
MCGPLSVMAQTLMTFGCRWSPGAPSDTAVFVLGACSAARSQHKDRYANMRPQRKKAHFREAAYLFDGGVKGL